MVAKMCSLLVGGNWLLLSAIWLEFQKSGSNASNAVKMPNTTGLYLLPSKRDATEDTEWVPIAFPYFA